MNAVADLVLKACQAGGEVWLDDGKPKARGVPESLVPILKQNRVALIEYLTPRPLFPIEVATITGYLCRLGCGTHELTETLTVCRNEPNYREHFLSLARGEVPEVVWHTDEDGGSHA